MHVVRYYCVYIVYSCYFDIHVISVIEGSWSIYHVISMYLHSPSGPRCNAPFVCVIYPAPGQAFFYCVVCRFGGSAVGRQQINEWQSYSDFSDSRLAVSVYSMCYFITPKVQSSHLFTHPCTYFYVTCSRAIIAGYKVNVTGIVRIIYIYYILARVYAS